MGTPDVPAIGDILEAILPDVPVFEIPSGNNDLDQADILHGGNNDLTTAVPEPSTLALVASGLIGGTLRRLRVKARERAARRNKT